MSSTTWTPDALSSSAGSLKGDCWRFVEAQLRVSTLKLVDDLAAQALLEDLIEAAKGGDVNEVERLIERRANVNYDVSLFAARRRL